MKASEIQKLSDQELSQKHEELKRKLMDLRFQLAMNKLTNYSQISSVKKDIARVKTIIRARELGLRR
ncbi:MAG: large subunit ribosomal protein [Kosmotogales bacterium]|jgi:large subunit ribosomal protein L29|nr:large subunit ribosomal protein [Kosmotogales bacterium]